jgi:hypothetical protein
MIRVSIVAALSAGLVLLAVPFYLWRKPDRRRSFTETPTKEQLAEEPAPRPGRRRSPAATVTSTESDPEPKVRLTAFRTLRCVKRSPGRTPPERCDHVDLIEQGLRSAIYETAPLGPKTVEGATVSIVMEIDFRKPRVKIYRGKSSSVSRSRTKELFSALRKKMPKPRWDHIPHDHYKYVVNIKATYPPEETF